MTEPIIEPNFEGEEMKLPQSEITNKTSINTSKKILSTSVIVILVVALLAIFAGLAYWYQQVMTSVTETIPEPPITIETKNNDTGSPIEISNSDEIKAIETDIDNTELDNLDQELEEIDAELEASLSV